MGPAALKEALRLEYRNLRDAASAKECQQSDAAILQRVLFSEEYQASRTLLVYVSFGSEVNTSALISQALADGKIVAVPVCDPVTCKIRFYRIASPKELRPAAYGIPEPEPDTEKEVVGDAVSFCIVPGLCFDRRGYRIGYGKGYYDRFLSAFPGKSVGLCRESGIYPGELPSNRFDLPVDAVFTDKNVYREN